VGEKRQISTGTDRGSETPALLRECGTLFWSQRRALPERAYGMSLEACCQACACSLCVGGVQLCRGHPRKRVLRTLLGGGRRKTDHKGWRGTEMTRRGALFGTAAVRGGLGYCLWVGAGACEDVQRPQPASPPLPPLPPRYCTKLGPSFVSSMPSTSSPIYSLRTQSYYCVRDEQKTDLCSRS